VARTAARAERQRLARDLHDSVTQTLIGLQLSAQAALDCWESQPERARAAVETIQRLARGACVEMRALLVDLRDDTLRRDGLAGALAQHAALIRRQSGLQVELRVGAAGAEAGARLPAAHEEALYRLAQEALANVVKHARYPRHRHAGPGATVRLQVEDDGVGFGAPAPAFAYGLAGMRERVAGLGGRLQLETRPGGGARVVAELPLPAATAGPADASAWGA